MANYKTPQLTDVMVELHVPSFAVAKKFYGKLGFKLVWERKPQPNRTDRFREGYMVMRQGQTILNFYCGTEDVYNHSYFKKWPKTSKRGYAVEIVLPIDNLQEFYRKVQKLFPKNIFQPPEKRFYFADFRMSDPFGFFIRFVDRYNWVDTRDKKGKPLPGWLDK